jgi:RNA polymerase-binding protein DksA
MDSIQSARHFDRLRRRRDEIMTTLAHVGKERAMAEENLDWLDQATYESRMALLDRLTDWYVKEIAQIDQALIRIAEKKYGECVGCHEAIESRRLEVNPEAAFCASCQALREDVARV